MRRPIALVLIALSIAFAGCVQTPTLPVEDATAPDLNEVEAFALERLVQDHDHHAAHAAHAGAIGLAPAAFAPARESEYPEGETYFELAVKKGYALLTFGPKSGYLVPGGEAGLIAYDVADPARPTEIGRWLGQPLGDVELTDDVQYAFAATQRNGYPYPYTVNPSAGAEAHAMRGTFILDLEDKGNPKVVGFAPLPTNGPHTITYFQAPDGRELLLASTYDFVFTTYPDNVGQNKATQKVVIYEFARDGVAPSLVPLGTFQVLEPDTETREFFPHDATAHVDPASGRVIMDIAYWDLGLVMVDITDPTQPTEIARFADTAPSSSTKTHLVRVFPGAIDGRVVAVLEPEIPTGDDDGQYTFVDVTEPENPVKLGYWSLPGDHVIDRPFVFSPHNFDVACGGTGQVSGEPIDYGAPCEDPTVVLSHFHGGLWTLDARDPANPRATGFFFPEVERDIPEGFPFTGFATAFVVDGWVYAPEAWTGLHVLRLPAADSA